MKLPDDMLPEEQDPQNEELITLLQHVNLNPMLVNPTERTLILSRANARLFPADPEVPQPEVMPAPELSGVGSFPSNPKALTSKPQRSRRLLHLLNMLAAVLVVAALIGASLLLFGPRSPLRQDRAGRAPFTGRSPFRSGFPQLIILATRVSVGQTLELKLSGFIPNTNVSLTHDGDQPVQTSTGASVVTVGQDGRALVEIFVDRSFLAGEHLIVAQEITTQATASETFRVVGSNPTGRPLLSLIARTIDMGAGRQGTRSTQHLLLENIGGEGPITWSVDRTPSWLSISPVQGTFTGSMTITIAVDRGTLPPGFYWTLVTFHQETFQFGLRISMTILPPGPVPILSAYPMYLTFNATYGQSNPLSQVVLITNTGVGKLYWNMSVDQSSLSAQPTRGVLSSGQTVQVTISVNARALNVGAGSNVGLAATLTEVAQNGNVVKGGGSWLIGLELKIV